MLLLLMMADVCLSCENSSTWPPHLTDLLWKNCRKMSKSLDFFQSIFFYHSWLGLKRVYICSLVLFKMKLSRQLFPWCQKSLQVCSGRSKCWYFRTSYQSHVHLLCYITPALKSTMHHICENFWIMPWSHIYIFNLFIFFQFLPW